MSRLVLTLLAVLLLAPSAPAAPLVRAKDADAPAQSAAALRLRMSLERFRELAVRQPSLHVSRSGTVAYKCARPRPAGSSARIVGEDNSTFLAPAPQPLANTFALHSRPTATRKLYLDFDGHVITGTDWNVDFTDPITVAAFDIDGVPGNFSDAERTVIQQIWRRVAEDYAPFDIDVTTEDPGVDGIVSNAPGDPNVGVRALIGDDAAYIGEDPASGILGLALVGTFGGVLDNPALVFSVSHGTDYAMIADTVSHEVGHTLGLEHHGDALNEYYGGHGIWAPIMGSGPSDSVSQWSRGDYAGASNPTQDDIAVIQGFLPLAPSDHAVDQAAADAAGAVVPTDILTGTLRSSADTAWYKFVASPGAASFTGSVASLGPNLKVGLSILDSAGNLVASSPTGLRPLSASLTANLPASGTYYLVVDGIGFLDVDTGFTDYASLGRFSVTGTWQVNRQPVASTAGSTPLLGKAPLRVTLDGRSSVDPDGTLVSHEWSFSDGQVATGTTPVVTFATPGTRTATLTVTDNLGAAHSATVTITATAGTSFARPMSLVSASAAWVTTSRSEGRATAAFRVVDSGGRPLPGVTVTATVSGLANATVTAVSDRAGYAVLSTGPLSSRARGTALFTVRSATLAPYEYLPSRNKVSTATLRR
jgi:PKD repeat protein